MENFWTLLEFPLSVDKKAGLSLGVPDTDGAFGEVLFFLLHSVMRLTGF